MTESRKMPAVLICERFGGLTRFAQAFDPPKQLSTVQRWLASGYIPARHQRAVLDAAKRAKVNIKASDFIPTDDALAA